MSMADLSKFTRSSSSTAAGIFARTVLREPPAVSSLRHSLAGRDALPVISLTPCGRFPSRTLGEFDLRPIVFVRGELPEYQGNPTEHLTRRILG